MLTGGELLDPGSDRAGRYDVAVRNGRIAMVAPRLPRDDAAEVADLTGRLVTPGLVDLHTHVYPGATYWGIDPDPVAWRSGVTTWVDAGSAGAYSFPAFAAAAAGYAVRVPALLNISAVGLIAPVGESRELANCDVELAVATVRAHRHTVVGIKVRMDRHNVGTHGLTPLRRAVEAAQACELPVMVHIGAGPPTIAQMLPLLRPGDIITHCASGIAAGPAGVAAGPAGIAAGPAGSTPAAREAYRAGVLFDIGHGSGGFAFDVLEAQLAAGMPPHTVSTDLHSRSLHGPAFDLPTTMAKMLAVGMSLPQVVAAATVGPARALGLPGGVGTLGVGAPADIAVFAVQDGRFEYVDVHGQRRHAPTRLVNELTYRAGRPLPPRLPQPVPPWVPLTDAQRHALAGRERAVRHLLTPPLVGPDGLAEQFPRHGG
ncbi:amidohydrolase/deacetylase family metallohydrolase [Plantactinospora sp. S1510]|uniref:Amidohydrolase/deacetylase family metallohydrolase n=1 Tax=Plantactinospora alkalitolerans TaxID=2789879 RepID=A0ABS0GZV4_9ACTN|nr:amidohydrolase/deacetylase family metallohydrolase [Plantactinospora alkalitolerans]